MKREEHFAYMTRRDWVFEQFANCLGEPEIVGAASEGPVERLYRAVVLQPSYPARSPDRCTLRASKFFSASSSGRSADHP